MFGAWQRVQRTVRWRSDGYIPTGCTQSMWEVANDVAHAADFAARQGTVL